MVAISSRALFNLEEENRIFESGDDAGYMKLQLERLDVPAAPGIAYSLVRKLLRFNDDGVQRVEVVILSRNDPVSGMRVFRSGAANGISLQRGVFTQGRPPFGYLRPLRAHLFLSANARGRARSAGRRLSRRRGCCVESVHASDAYPERSAHRLRRRRRALQRRSRARVPGARASMPSRRTSRARPRCRCPTGPSSRCSRRCTGCSRRATPAMRIRTALVTARSAPAHERAIRTLMNWNIKVDEAMFLGGLPKGEFLREFEPDFFFDDQTGHVDCGRAPRARRATWPAASATRDAALSPAPASAPSKEAAHAGATMKPGASSARTHATSHDSLQPLREHALRPCAASARSPRPTSGPRRNGRRAACSLAIVALNLGTVYMLV